MARKSKVLNSLSNVICDEYIINDNEIESVNVSCEFVYEIEANDNAFLREYYSYINFCYDGEL